MKTGIYIIRNTVNGKVYVGSAVDVAHRWVVHRKNLRDGDHHSGHLQYAWELYGADAFEFVLIEPVLLIEDLVAREQYWIDHFHSADGHFGYNVAPRAGSTLGLKASDETKRRLSQVGRGRKQAPEHVAKRMLAHRGKKRPEATRARLKVARNRRAPASAETILKNKLGSTRAWQNPALRERVSKKRTAYCQTEQGLRDREMQRAAAKDYWADPDNRAAQAEARRQRWLDPEYRAKVLAGQEAARERKKALQERPDDEYLN